MKRIGCLFAALCLADDAVRPRRGGGRSNAADRVALYQQEDTFIETVARELQRVAQEEEQARTGRINLYITDGKESQTSTERAGGPLSGEGI
ncbi:MAG: hypothetical protein ACLUS6_15825 [Dysosmobacter sp.]